MIFFVAITLSCCMSVNHNDSVSDDIKLNNDKIAPVKFLIKGISFVATEMKVNNSNIQPIKDIHANWISLMPYAYSPWGQEVGCELAYNSDFQWRGEKDEGIIEAIILAHQNGLKVMVKPHLWLNGNYTGDFVLSNEKDWAIWEKNYANYILHFAFLADSLKAEMFCIGTELKLTISNRPVFWNKLIDSIKTFYEGELTYAANWDDYQDVPFWEQLDYIGINGYFPLSSNTSPSVEELCIAWRPTILAIENFQNKIKKPILFTEIGYKSVNSCAEEPWNPVSNNCNMLEQANATEAFFKCYDNMPWFVGCFIWKWYPDHDNSGGKNDDDYTPQNKPTADLIRKYFKN